MSRQATLDVLAEVVTERASQDARWGEQNHPDGTGIGFAHEAAYRREICDERFAEGDGSWSDILLEEVYEALAERGADALRAELVQVAAVAVSWIEAIDRRAA